MIKRVAKISLIVFLVLLGLMVAFFVAVRYPSVQTYLAQRATTLLSNTLQTKVSIERVEISFFNNAHFVNFYLEDHNQDTLISAQELTISFKLFDLWNKKVNVKSIALDGATVHLHRDSTGEHMNLTELFKSFQSTKPTTPRDTTGFSWHIDLKELALRNTDFRYLDESSHTDVKVLVPSLEVDLEKLSVSDKLVHINSARIDGAQVAIDLLTRISKPDTDSAMLVHFMPGGMQLRFDEFQITNTHFRLNDHNSDTILKKGMDFKHLDVSDINLFAINGSIIADTILTQVQHLAAKERSGFRLDSLRAMAKVTANEITLAQLNLKTPNSQIRNYLSFRFNVYRDFKDFLHKVEIKTDFSKTQLSLKDLSYFLKGLDKAAHNKILVSGKIDGTVTNLRGKDIEIRSGSSTVFKGSFFTNGLPDVYETFVSLKVKQLSTTIADVKRFYPGIKFPENLNTLGTLNYTGSLDGFLTDFVSNGKFTTAIGSANTDVNFKYDKKNNKAFYKGNLALNEFDLGIYFGDQKNLGKVSLLTKINGGGLTLESLKAELDGNISSITVRNYNYQNIKIDGFVVKKSFNGSMNIKDEFLDMDFNGRADLGDSIPDFKFDAHVRKAFLKNLNLVKEDITVKGDFKSDFAGAKIDDMAGTISLNNVTVTRDSVTAFSKYLKLDIKNSTAKGKSILLNSDFAEGEMEGNFTFRELPKALISFANYTFTKDYIDTSAAITPQNFTIDLRIYEPNTLTQIIHPKFYLIRNSRVQGSFNSIDHKLNVTASVPDLEFGNFNVKRTDISTSFENRKFTFQTSADKVYSGDSIMLDTLNIRAATLENEDVRFDISIADKKHFNYANITSYLTPYKGHAVVRIEPSDIKLGNYNWHFNQGNFIFIEGKKITTNNLIFRTSDQSLYITSYLKNDTSTSFKLTLDNTELGDFMGIFTQKMNDLHGAVNGKLVVEDVFYKPQMFADLVVNDFTLGSELIGDVNIESRLDEASKKILLYASVKSSNPNPLYRNYLEAKGFISIDAANPEMKIDVTAPKVGLNFLNYKFFDRYVKNCKGYAIINATVTGTPSKPLLNGDVTLTQDTLTVSFLNTTYHIGEHKIILDEHGFNVGNITIFDINNNPIYGVGRINHKSFRDFAFDLRVTTPNAQFLNTMAHQSPNFYGVAYGRGNIYFTGPVKNISIKGYATTRPGTWCRLPINHSYEINRYGFYRFLSKETNKTSIPQKAPELKLTGVNFTLELDVTPDARMDIILDPISGDILTSYGKGNLKIEIPRNGSTTIYGTYEIDAGKYLFTLQSVVNKPFVINRGGTVNFTGDVYKAALNIEATYEVRSSMTDLISDLIASSVTSGANPQLEQAARTRVPVRLQMSLTGILERPNIAFDIKAIDVDPTIKSYVDQRLALLKSNEKELNNQVFGLLVLQRFLPSQTNNSGNSIQGYVGGAAANTVSEFLSSQFSNYLSNLIGYTGKDALQNLDINIGYRQYDQANPAPDNTVTTDTRRELQFAIQQRLLNNRLTINAGGNLDFGSSTPVGGTEGRSVIPTGDFQIQYALTKDGRWKAKAFNRTNYDYFNTRNNNRTGIGVSFTKEFDKPAELFKKKKPKKKKEEEKKTAEAKKSEE